MPCLEACIQPSQCHWAPIHASSKQVGDQLINSAKSTHDKIYTTMQHPSHWHEYAGVYAGSGGLLPCICCTEGSTHPAQAPCKHCLASTCTRPLVALPKRRLARASTMPLRSTKSNSCVIAVLQAHADQLPGHTHVSRPAIPPALPPAQSLL